MPLKKRLKEFLNPYHVYEAIFQRRRMKRNIIAVYLITHLPSGKFYIGSTGCLVRRLSTHKAYLKAGNHSNKVLQELFDEAPNMDNFSFHHWPFKDREEAYRQEDELLKRNQDSPDLVNEKYKAKGSGGHSPATRERMSNTRKGVPKPPGFGETRAGEKNPGAVAVLVHGVRYPTIQKAACVLNINKHTLYARLKSHNVRWKDYQFAEVI